MLEVKDQMNNVIRLGSFPRRIISLVPSQTELLIDLGLEDRLIGITNYCIHPRDKVKSINKVGGTKRVNLKKVAKLQPDLIIANKEENLKEEIEELQEQYPVWISDIQNLNNALDMITSIGKLTNKEDESCRIATEISTRFETLTNRIAPQKQSVAYFIWRAPWMIAAKGTFIDHIIHLLKLQNTYQTTEERYLEIQLPDLQEQNPDHIFLSSEPFPFKEKHQKELQELFPNSKVHLVDGEMFSWYGTRLLHAPEYFEDLLQKL